MNCILLALTRWFPCLTICFLVGAGNGSELSTEGPTYSPIGQYCYGTEYTSDIGANFVQCGIWHLPDLNVETCDDKFQEDLYFGVANTLLSTCWSAECIYSSLELAFRWDEEGICYSAVYNDGNEPECWETKYNSFWKSGALVTALELICFSTQVPTVTPTQIPTMAPTENPTVPPTAAPTQYPSSDPTQNPTQAPTMAPTENPSAFPTTSPTQNPSSVPTTNPTQIPTVAPTENPTAYPTTAPTQYPSPGPTTNPTETPTQEPTMSPTQTPTQNPTRSPTLTPTQSPTTTPTNTPTPIPTQFPTHANTSTVLLSAEVSCITEMQIADTIAPLGRFLNVSEWMISMYFYTEMTWNITGLEVAGFLINYHVLVDDTEELFGFITADNITDEFAQELATEFNNASCSIIVESIRATSLGDSSTDGYGEWLVPWICGVIIFLLCILFIMCLTRRAKSDEEEDMKQKAGVTSGTGMFQTIDFSNHVQRTDAGEAEITATKTLDGGYEL